MYSFNLLLPHCQVQIADVSCATLASHSTVFSEDSSPCSCKFHPSLASSSSSKHHHYLVMTRLFSSETAHKHSLTTLQCCEPRGLGPANAMRGLDGTPGRLPPHPLQQQQTPPPYDAKKVDAWAMGVVLYLLVTGTYPFEVLQHSDIVIFLGVVCRKNIHA